MIKSNGKEPQMKTFLTSSYVKLIAVLAVAASLAMLLGYASIK